MHSLFTILFTLTAIFALGQSNHKNQQLEHASSLFLGTPYKFSSIKDPLLPEQGAFYDTSYLDCMTYVMSVIALNENPENWLNNWLTLRYQNSYDFWGRNHFATIDFNPILKSRFNFSDLSTQISGHLNQTFLVQKPLWLLTQIPKLCQKESCKSPYRIWQKFSNQPAINTTISVIPYNVIIKNRQLSPAFVNKLPSIAIIEFIRLGWPVGEMIQIPVSHMGFLIKKNNRLILRHAKWKQSVQDEDFLTYIKTIQFDPSHLGIHLLTL